MRSNQYKKEIDTAAATFLFVTNLLKAGAIVQFNSTIQL